LGLALLGLLFLANAARAQGGFQTLSYDVTLTVKKDRTVEALEVITVRFTEPRHGLKRWIPVRYPDRHGGHRAISIDDVSVRCMPSSGRGLSSWREEEGTAEQVAQSRSGNNLELKIGSASVTRMGLARYTIRYRASGALTDFLESDGLPDRTELYWNAVPTGWATSIKEAHVTIRFPNKNSPSLPAFRAWVSSMGSQSGIGFKRPGAPSEGTTDRLTARFSLDSKKANGAAEALASRGLRKGEGITVAVAMAKGSVDWQGPRPVSPPGEDYGLPLETSAEGAPPFGLGLPLEPLERAARPEGWLALGVAVPLALLMRWLLRPPPMGPIATRYSPPEDVGPAEAGTLLDYSFDTDDIVAGIVALAQKGALTLRSEGRDGIESTDGLEIVMTQGTHAPNLTPIEWRIAKSLEEFGPVVSLDEIQGQFGYAFSRIRSYVSGWAIGEGLYRGSPAAMRLGPAIVPLAGGAVVAGSRSCPHR
jgi:hypothetical protein